MSASTPTRAALVAGLAALLGLPLTAQRLARFSRAGGEVSLPGMEPAAALAVLWGPMQRGHGAGSRVGATPGRAPLGGGLDQLRQMPPGEQEKRLEQDPKFQSLPPKKQQQMLSRLEWFNSLPKDQQNRILTRLQHLGELTPAQRTGLEDIYRQWQGMAPDRRQAFHAAYNNLSRLTPDQQERRMSSPRFQERFSPDEQKMLRQALDLRLPPDVVGAPAGGQPDGPR